MRRATLAALCVLAALAAPHARASDLARHTRFAALFGSADAFTAEAPRALSGGLVISGEHLQLENGSFSANIQTVSHPYFVMSGLVAKGRLPLDDAFFADAITAAINDLLDGSTVHASSFKNARGRDDVAGITLRDIVLVHNQKHLEGSLRALIARPEFRGHSRYDKATRTLTVTVESVKIAGIPVPLAIAFFTMQQFMGYPFVHLHNPDVIVDLKPFLPPPGR